MRVDVEAGRLDVLVDTAELMARDPVRFQQPQFGMGRELFAAFRNTVGPAETGASIFF